MTDDAPPNGRPGSSEPPPPAPDRTVMRPNDPAAAPPPDAGQTVMRPSDPRPGPAVDNPDVPPGATPPGGGPATVAVPTTPGTPGGAGSTAVPATSGGHDGAPPAHHDDGVDHDFPTKASKAGLTSALAALGTGLLAAAVVISAIKSRENDGGDLDWSNYGAGLAAAAALLLLAVLAALVSRRHVGGRAREEAVTWPGAVGILAAALMVKVGLEIDEAWLTYAIGAGIVVLAALGYLATRRAAFVVVAIVGLGVLYARGFEDLVADRIDEDQAIAVTAAAIAVFVIVVTVLGWILPTRVVSGVAVGAFGVAAYAVLLAILLLTQLLSTFFGGPSPLADGAGDEGSESMLGLSDANDSDVWWIVAFAGVLTLLWALAAAISNRSGFAVLAILMPTVVAPLALVLLAEKHPSYWSGALAAAGALLLLGGVLLARQRSRRKVEGLAQTY